MRVVKRIGIIIGGCVILFIIGFGIMFIGLSQNMKEIRTIPITDIDFSKYEDGTYQGLYYYENQIGATVELHIEDGKAVSIIFLDHKYGLGGKAEIIIEDIIEEQTLLVDDISGATTSSHIIKLAIQNALEEVQ